MIHKEGYFLCTIALLIGGGLPTAAHYLFPIAFYPALVLGVFAIVAVFQFFRNPKRRIPKKGENLIYAPADGKVVVIEDAFEPEFLKEKCIQVSIFMSPINVHVNRIPISGKILYAKYHPGKYLVAWDPKSSTENERTSIAIETGTYRIMMRQIAGAVARRIKYYVKENQMVYQGEEFGFIKFGSRVDLYLPLGSTIVAKINEHVKGNLDVIAELPG
jgi:phosphatidylserine decarboxylase